MMNEIIDLVLKLVQYGICFVYICILIQRINDIYIYNFYTSYIFYPSSLSLVNLKLMIKN